MCTIYNVLFFHSRNVNFEKVKYAPKIKLTINEENNDDGILENAEVKVTCMATANPEEITYKWFINNEMVVGDYTTEMVSEFLHDLND